MHLPMVVHMDPSDTFIADVEAALERDGVSAARLCRTADIAESTWHRCTREGVKLRPSTRNRIEGALKTLGIRWQAAPAPDAAEAA